MTTPTIFQWYQILRQHYRCTVLQAIRGVTKKEKLILTDSGKGTPAGNIIGTMALHSIYQDSEPRSGRYQP